MKDEISGDTPDSEKNWLDQLPIRIKKKFWNADKIISLSAFVVSIATLLALMYQIRLSGEQNELAQKQQELVRKQQYASVLPYLELQIGTNNGDRLFELLLYNNGVGPAFIEEIRTVYNGQAYPGPPSHFYRAVMMPEDQDTINLGLSNIHAGNLIPAGKETAMMTAYRHNSSSDERDRLVEWFGRPTEHPELARVEIVYSSVYGERWIVKGLGAIPEALPAKEAE